MSDATTAPAASAPALANPTMEMVVHVCAVSIFD